MDMQTDYSEKLTELIEIGLTEGSCVLFVGPDLIKFDGLDYNHAFYNTLPDESEKDIDKRKAKFNAVEKIWSFSSSTVKSKFFIKLTDFLKNNTDISNPIFSKLAALPFPLIVSLVPDDSLFRAFSEYSNLNVSFKSSLESNVPEPSIDNMLIYNIYGNIKNRK